MTLLEKFKKDHPNAPMNIDGTPKLCPGNIGYCAVNDCDNHGYNCVRCWDREYEGEDNPVETVEESTDVADKIIATYDKLCERFDYGWSNSIMRDLISGGYFKDGN